VSWRSRGKAGVTALGALVAIGIVGAAGAVIGAAAVIGVAGAGGTAQVAEASVTGVTGADPTPAVTHQVSGTAQRGALAHWTPQRMRTATAPSPVLVRPGLPATTRGPAQPTQPTQSQAVPEIAAPKGIPRAVPFSGSPTTGALFYTTGGKNHFCTASVVDSTAGDMVLTAAHCVYGKNFATNIEYVPGYHDGKQPYGAWPVAKITVASGWESSHNPNLDFAFLTTASMGGQPIQARTGGLTIGFTRWYNDKIEVIGHNDTDAEPIRCATKSFKFRTGQMEFYCHGFWTGTSGGPWIIGYNAKTGTGTVFGVIGGYEGGGDYEWASYSAYFGSATRSLYQQVERQTPPVPKPMPTMTPAKSAPTVTSASPTTTSASPTTSPTPATPPSASPATPPTASPATPTPSPATPPPTTAPSSAPSVTSTPTPTATGSVSTAYHPMSRVLR
jgi:V8-like Glu-specific endopeptidase